MLASLALSLERSHGPPFGSGRRRTLQAHEAGGAQPDQFLDWTWPAADTFTDDNVSHRTLQTCSQLGSQRIRLVKIRPGCSVDRIDCDSKVCFLSQAGEYTTLSYTWECPVARCQVFMDDQPRLVTVSLWRFLRQARKLPGLFSGWLWIDALSIEQSDHWEKLEQVKVISTIFASATQAVIWLGPAYGNSDRAMDYLASERKKPPHWRAPRSVWASPVSSAMLELCDRPYWHRLWIYQELKASRAIAMLCGGRYARVDALESLLYNDEDERVQAKVQALQFSSAGKMLSLIRTSSKGDLEPMLVITRHLLCTDPRDRVYAILAVVSSGHQGIEADYTISLIDLVNAVLRNIHAFQQPSIAQFLSIDCIALGDIFGMRYGSICMTKDESSATRDLVGQFGHVQSGNCLNDQTILILQDMLGWCKRHNHRAVARMVSTHMSAFWGLDDRDSEEEITKQALDDDSEGDVESKLALREKILAARKVFEDFASSP